MHRVGIESTGIGRISQVVDATKEIGRLAGDHDDGPFGAEPDDFIRGEQGTALQMLAPARRMRPRLKPAPFLVRAGGRQTRPVETEAAWRRVSLLQAVETAELPPKARSAGLTFADAIRAVARNRTATLADQISLLLDATGYLARRNTF
jgi:hypothetical protein